MLAVQNVWLAIPLLLMMIPYFLLSVKNGRQTYDAYKQASYHFRRAEDCQNVLRDRNYTEERTLFQYGEWFNDLWADQSRTAIEIERKTNFLVFSRMEGLNVLAVIIIFCFSILLVRSVIAGSMSLGLLMAAVKGLVNYLDRTSVRFANVVTTYEKGRNYYRDYQKFQEIHTKDNHSKNQTDAGGTGTTDVDQASKDPEGKGRTVKNMIEKGRTAEGAEPDLSAIRSIAFDNVSFRYPGSDTCALNHLSFTLDGRCRYAFVGENGAGKSTIVKLLLGMYDSYEGTIRINGKDIRQIPAEELRQVFSYVPQEVTHYEVRLDEYLKSGDLSNIRSVFRKLQIDFVDLKNGFPLLGKLEKKSRELSGGQWQLLAIARAMLSAREADLWDEPTASIDPVREAEISRLFYETTEQRLAVIVTHRLGAARAADEILVISNGALEERGTHEELMKCDGHYSLMFKTQQQWYRDPEKRKSHDDMEGI